MSRNDPSRPYRVTLLAACVLAALVPATFAQTPPTQPATVVFAADESSLWLAQAWPDRTKLYCRGISGNFENPTSLHTPVVRLVSTANRLFAFMEDGRLFMYDGSQWRPAANLPGRMLPLDAIEVPNGFAVLVPSPAPDTLPQLVDGERPATSQPFQPGPAPLSVLRYDSGNWGGVAACPVDVKLGRTPLGPRILYIRDVLHLFWWVPEQRAILCAALNADDGTWSKPRAIANVDALEGFWITVVGGLPTLVVADHGPANAPRVTAYRYLGRAASSAPTWRVTPVEFSALLEGMAVRQVLDATGFNQHVALFVRLKNGEHALQFGRFDGRPSEKTLNVEQILADGGNANRGPQWVQTAAVVALFAVIVALLVFRRSVMFESVTLAPEWTLAFTFQRLLGFIVDVTPFLLVGAFIIRVDWWQSLGELSGWAMGNDAVSGNLPAPRVLLWWGISTGAYTLYAIVAELLTHRTFGKLLMRTSVMAERGGAPSAVQVVIRNALRFVELLPPFWVLGFLVVLSRNRQRVGDTFARTIVVRRQLLRPQQSTDTQPPERNDDSSSNRDASANDDTDESSQPDEPSDDDRPHGAA